MSESTERKGDKKNREKNEESYLYVNLSPTFTFITHTQTTTESAEDERGNSEEGGALWSGAGRRTGGGRVKRRFHPSKLSQAKPVMF